MQLIHGQKPDIVSAPMKLPMLLDTLVHDRLVGAEGHPESCMKAEAIATKQMSSAIQLGLAMLCAPTPNGWHVAVTIRQYEYKNGFPRCVSIITRKRPPTRGLWNGEWKETQPLFPLVGLLAPEIRAPGSGNGRERSVPTV